MKEIAYQTVYRNVQSLIKDEPDPIAVMATITCELFHGIPWIDWVGFYRLVNDCLKVGPYQGPRACPSIPITQGVCGKAVREKAPQLVPDVHAIPYHIACSDKSRSEIVVPLFSSDGAVAGVLDADSNLIAAFDETDLIWLEKIIDPLERLL